MKFADLRDTDGNRRLTDDDWERVFGTENLVVVDLPVHPFTADDGVERMAAQGCISTATLLQQSFHPDPDRCVRVTRFLSILMADAGVPMKCEAALYSYCRVHHKQGVTGGGTQCGLTCVDTRGLEQQMIAAGHVLRGPRTFRQPKGVGPEFAFGSSFADGWSAEEPQITRELIPSSALESPAPLEPTTFFARLRKAWRVLVGRRP